MTYSPFDGGVMPMKLVSGTCSECATPFENRPQPARTCGQRCANIRQLRLKRERRNAELQRKAVAR